MIGDGPANAVVFLEIVQHLDLCWTDPHTHYNFERMAGFTRFAVFHRRAGILPAEQSPVTTFDRAALTTAPRAPRTARTVVRVGNALQRRRATR